MKEENWNGKEIGSGIKSKVNNFVGNSQPSRFDHNYKELFCDDIQLILFQLNCNFCWILGIILKIEM